MEVKWSDLALKQLDDILDYVEERFGSRTAIKTLEKINSKVNRLMLFPESGSPDFGYSTLVESGSILIRHLKIEPNVVYYNVDGDVINVMAIAHSKQSPMTVASMIKRFLEHNDR